MKWEQFVLELPKSDGLVSPKAVIDFTNNLLMEYGSQGWELVSVDNGIAYFKRQSNMVETKQKRYGYDTVQDGYVIYDNYNLVKLSGFEVETLLNND